MMELGRLGRPCTGSGNEFAPELQRSDDNETETQHMINNIHTYIHTHILYTFSLNLSLITLLYKSFRHIYGYLVYSVITSFIDSERVPIHMIMRQSVQEQ